MLGLTPINWFLVPGPLLLLIATTPLPISTLEAQWPYNLSPHIKYFPGDESVVRRNLDIQEQFAKQKPVGLHKMSSDPGEMFFPEYWRFDDDDNDKTRSLAVAKRAPISSLSEHSGDRDDLGKWRNNATLLHTLQAPILIHGVQQIESRSIIRRLPRIHHALFSILNSRDFKCPDNTFSCISINRAYSCCTVGDSCQLIAQSSLGDVGCCAEGQTCSQQLSGCQDGYTSCPGDSGGGCCIPGYECIGVGCKLAWMNRKRAILIFYDARCTYLHRHGPGPTHDHCLAPK